MRVDTLHAPHGREVQPYVCPKCHHTFEAFFELIRHVREAHKEPKGLGR
jgi:uncharacterized C2H2 Zn-finger protein